VQLVFQTVFETGQGNCMSAALASLLDLNINEVPNFRVADIPWQSLQEWLSTFNLFALQFDITPLMPLPDTYCILSGISVKDVNKTHAVVGVVRTNEIEIIHDPDPAGCGFEMTPRKIMFLVERKFSV